MPTSLAVRSASSSSEISVPDGRKGFIPVFLTLLALITPAHAHHHSCDRVCGSKRYMHRIVRPFNTKLNRMANCESTNRWYLNTGNGFYGGLQFSKPTWQAVGGRGYPYQSSELEQKYRAVKWYYRIRTWVTNAGWPRCGYA